MFIEQTIENFCRCNETDFYRLVSYTAPMQTFFLSVPVLA